MGPHQPILSSIEPTFDFWVHGSCRIPGFFVRDDAGPGFGAVRCKRTRANPGRCQLLHVPPIHGWGVQAALGDVVRRAEESEMEVIVVGIAGLAAHLGETFDRSGGLPLVTRVVEKKRTQVLRQENLLKLRRFVLDERSKKQPITRDVQAQGDIVRWIR